MRNGRDRRAAGFTLIEVVVALAVSVVVMALAVQAMIAFTRDRAVRGLVTQMQGTARLALGTMERDLRHASLGAGSGTVWTGVSGARAARPAVQIFSGIAGGGTLGLAAKPNTDAVLVVELVSPAVSAARAATVGDLTSTTGAIPVTTAAGFGPGQPILMGDWGEAAWGVVSTVSSSTPPQLTLVDQSVNVVPGQQVRRLPSGSFVRPAQVRMYYVNTNDELVRLTLAAPRPPSSAADIVSWEVIGQGFENMKISGQLDNGTGGFDACPGATSCPVLGTSDPLSTDASDALGSFATGTGPLLTAANVSKLRTLVVEVAVRSLTPVRDLRGDPPIPLAGVTVPVGGSDPSAAYVRRAYQVAAGIRNTSLWVF